MYQTVTRLFQSTKELCFPAVCVLCRQKISSPENIHLCPNCFTGLTLITSPICSCCGKEFSGVGEDHLCSECLVKPPHFSRARSVVRYDAAIAQLVHGFKYSGNTACRSTFKGLYDISLAAQHIAGSEMIVPVPLYSSRLQERGFNQALLLARYFFPDHQVEPTLLYRNRETAAQTGLKGIDRRRNLKGAFSVKDADKVNGKRIVLVDDVLTTGTTVNECAKTLKMHGAKEVEVLTLARVAG